MKRIMPYLTLVCLAFGASAPAATLLFPDPIGETQFPEHDLAGLRTEAVGNNLEVTVVYARTAGLLEMNFGDLFIDGDLNADTGVRLGADCLVEYIFSGAYSGGFIMLSNRTIRLGEEGTSLQAGTNTITFVLPLTLWGGSSDVRLFAGSAWTLESTDFDRVPDAGWLETQTGHVVHPRPGNPAVHVVRSDPRGDALFPDMTGLEMKVSEGNLQLWLTFAHGVEYADLQQAQDTLVIDLGLDLDKRLWTGFRNNHEDPPTFGFDRDITLMLSHLFHQPSAILRWQVPADPDDALAGLLPQLEGIGLGSQSTDTRLVIGQSTRFHTASNQIFLSIPLGYLGSSDGEMYVAVSAFLEATLTAGHADALPDTGAVDSTVGLTPAQTVHPVAFCAINELTNPDDPDDSIGFGYQGDEIVSSRACPLSDGGLKITTDLESVEMSDLAFVNLFVDADGSTATGVPFENGTTERMGVDFYLTCRVAPTPDPGIVTALLVDYRWPPLVPWPRRADQLVSLRLGGTVGSGQRGAWYSITLPPEILGAVAGATARYVITTTQQSYSTADQESAGDRKQPGVVKVDPAGMPAGLDVAPEAGFYHVNAPAALPLAISSVIPSRGTATGGFTTRIFGSSFTKGAEVRFGTTLVPAQNVRFISSGEMVITTPAGTPGAVAVSIRNPDGAQFVKSSAFFYGPPLLAPPEVWSVEPSLGPVGGGQTIRIDGLNFVSGASVNLGGWAANGVNVLSPLQMTAITPPGQPGAAEVMVANPDGQSGRLPEGYSFGSRPTAFWTLFPNYGPLAGGTLITIVGERFQASTQIRLDGSALSQLEFVSDRVMKGRTPVGTEATLADLSITNSDGVGRLVPAAFAYNGSSPGWPSPTILGVTPYSSPAEGGTEVSILGSGFQEGAAVFIDDVPVWIHYFDTGLLKVIAPPHASGMVPITVVNVDSQQATLPIHQEWDSFSYSSDQPSIWMVSGMSSSTEGGERVTIYGSAFKPGPPSSLAAPLALTWTSVPS